MPDTALAPANVPFRHGAGPVPPRIEREPRYGREATVFQPATSLRLIRTVHTAAWAVFAGSILAIPVLAWGERWFATALLIALVLGECLVLAVNRMRCPLTDLAARYTDDRRDNFDIYLPEWLARHNKRIFGWLFVAGLLFTAARWWR
jgi:hypothetical protein